MITNNKLTKIYYYYCYYFTPSEFFPPASSDSLSLESHSKSSANTLLSILADLNNVIVLMILIRTPIFIFFTPLSKTLGIGPSDENLWEFNAILVYAYTICLYGQISISCTLPSGSTLPPGCTKSYTHFVPVYFICLRCD